MSRLAERYQKEIAPALAEKLGLANPHRIPRFAKIVVNMGIGEGAADAKAIAAASEDLAMITGQKPVVTKARKSIAGFKLREGMPVGCRVTLRGKRMYEFLDRLIAVALPRIRDFRGFSPNSFDGRGNYTFGLEEQVVFPEVDIDRVSRVQGMDVTLVTTARTDEEGRELLAQFGFPFSKT